MKSNHTKILSFGATVCLVSVMPSSAAILLFSDNFNSANVSIDASYNPSATGRLGGTLASSMQVRTARVDNQQITNNRVVFDTDSTNSRDGRIGFYTATTATTSGGVRFDFAAGTTGTSILAAGGMRFEFDIIPVNITATNIISFTAGISTGGANLRITDNGTDYGILFRNNGGTAHWDNGTATDTTSFVSSLTPQRVVIDLFFSSFADGANVNAKVKVGTTTVDDYNFTWSGNSGVANFEIGANLDGNAIDNLSISTVPEPSTVMLGILSTLGLLIRRR